MNERILTWDGCTNVRDLGGLRTNDGRVTCWGAVVRSDTPAKLTATGWEALYTYDIRTIVSLRTYGLVENELDFTPPHPDLVTVQVEIEDVTDREFVEQWAATGFWSTPLYYNDALRRWPKRHAAAIAAIAQARPGGVLFHCVRGHDRTGIIALLLLALIGVTVNDMVADYELSRDPERDAILAHENTSVRETILGAIEGLDVDHYLRLGGISRDNLTAVRKRLLG